MGTGGIRAYAVDHHGSVVAHASIDFPKNAHAHKDSGIHEQNPESWWNAFCTACQKLVQTVGQKGIPLKYIRTVCIDGTSGTLVCLNEKGAPVRDAIMYNDPRGKPQAEHLNAITSDHCAAHGYRFASSYALAKILWLRENEPEIFNATAHFVHQADFAVGRLCGNINVTDYSNALKTGFDLIHDHWPSWLDEFPDIRVKLPETVPPGSAIGNVTPRASEETGLPVSAVVVAGATDGVAACLASGASRIGDTNVTLGTTLVFKRVSQEICSRPDGLLYSHKLPDGYWLPGAASNTGAEWTRALFPDEFFPEFDKRASAFLPTQTLSYPLVRSGERFPFLCPEAKGFCLPEPTTKEEKYASHLQGVALVERLALDVLDSATKQRGVVVFATGTPSKSDAWTQLRADVTQRVYRRPQFPESAFGSAILGAKHVFGNLETAVNALVKIEKVFEPRKELAGVYDELFSRFCRILEDRNYL